MGEICFDGYLRSLVDAYQKWDKQYTLTDVKGRSLQEKIVTSRDVANDEPSFDYFDFRLMVQTVDKEKVESQKEKGEEEKEKKEKIERFPVLEGICKYAGQHDLGNHVLLVGRPGSGKSTALARLLLQEAENALSDRNAKIPVLVELRYLPSEANEWVVCDRIRAFMLKHDPDLQLDVAAVENLLRQGRLLLLVDGVNELPSERSRHQVNVFRQDYQETCPMIFTTRELSAGGDLGIAKKLEMQPLTELQMQQFVMAYLPTQGERLLRQLSGRLREFGQTPLLLWMLCSLFRQTEQIPPNLGMVFRAFTLGYGNQIKQDVPLYKDSRVWWGRLLQYLAFVMIVGESATEARVAISRREAERGLVEFLRGKVEHPDDCAIRWLEDLLKHHLLLVSNDQIEFRHQLIQEYYAAEWLLGLLPSLSNARLQHGYLNYLKWTEPLALMLELVESEEQAVRVVRLALALDLRLGARLAGAVKYGFQEKTVGLLLREIDERKIPKLYAIELFGETKSDFVVDSLIHILKDSDRYVISRAAKSLGKIGSDKAIETLIAALKYTSYSVRIIAAEELVKIGGDKVVQLLVETLIAALKDTSYSVQYRASKVLSMIGDKAVEPLIDTLKDEDYEVRYRAVEALGYIGNAKAVEPLIVALQDTNINVQCSAAKALGYIGNDKAVESLIIALQDANTCAAEALGYIGDDKAVEPLIAVLQDANYVNYNKYKKVRYSSLYVQDTMQSKAVRALGEIGSEKAVESLIDILLKNESIFIQWAAVRSLGKINSEKAVELLIDVLQDTNEDMRCKAAEALGYLVGDKVVDSLISNLKDESIRVQWRAAGALGKIGSKKAIQLLIDTLKDDNDDVRNKALESLGKIGSKKVIQPLIDALKDENDDDVRNKAAESLGYIGGNKVIQPLIDALKDDNDDVRNKAAESLGYIGNNKAVEPLIDTLKNDNDDVRWTAVNALEKISETDRNLLTLTQQLPHLLTLIPTESSQQALSVITAIQSRCKYYNYDIAQMTLPPEDKANPTNGNTYIFNKEVGQVIAGALTVHGNNIATQNNPKINP